MIAVHVDQMMRAMRRHVYPPAVVLAVASPMWAQTVPACTHRSPRINGQMMKTQPEPATLAVSDITTRTVADIVKLAVPKGNILKDESILRTSD